MAVDWQTEAVTNDYIRSLEERIQQLEAKLLHINPEIDYGAKHNTPEECRAHTCSYFTYYLAYGPAELQHEGYHAAENAFERHADSCKHEWARGNCPTCVTYEKRIRA